MAVVPGWKSATNQTESQVDNRLAFETRGLAILESSDFIDVWTGQAGVDKTMIVMAQESFYQDALNKGLAVPESAVDEYIASHLQKANLSNATWEGILSSSGVTIADARHRVRKILLANLAVKESVLQTVNVTSEDIEEFFAKNKKKFNSPDPSKRGQLPKLVEVQDIINRTIRNQKVKSAGQEYINKLLHTMVRDAVASQPQSREPGLDQNGSLLNVTNEA